MLGDIERLTQKQDGNIFNFLWEWSTMGSQQPCQSGSCCLLAGKGVGRG